METRGKSHAHQHSSGNLQDLPEKVMLPDHNTHMEHDRHSEERTTASEIVTSSHAVTATHSKPVSHIPHGGNKEHTAAHIDHKGHETVFRQRFWVSLVLSIPVLLYSPMIQEWLGFSMPDFRGSNWLPLLFSSAVFLYGGVPFISMAVPEFRNRQPGMMTLISMAICVAFLYSVVAMFLPGQEAFFWELVTLIDIMLLGHWLEMRSIRQATGALNELARLMPDTAERIFADGRNQIVPIEQLMLGDMVLVRPGTSIPADGVVAEGKSDVNEAMITGESRPITKEAGDPVIAGTINGGSSLRIEITATGDQTALAGIMRLVEQAQQSKSKTQILADRAAGWLFYVALAVAILTAIGWIVATGLNVEVVARVATVLVIACPHALGLAIPLVVAITTSIGARNGILVRDRLSLERSREIDTVIFDKTGTLTHGEFGVVDIQPVGNLTEEEVLGLAAAVEGDSEHTIAQGIRRSAKKRGIEVPEVLDFQAIQGRGVKALVGDKPVYVGGPRMLEMLGISLPQELQEFERKAGEKGYSLVNLITDGRVVASFSLSDLVREESKPAVKELQALGLEVVLLTGDNLAVARAVAEDLGIKHYYAEVLPKDKDNKVSELQNLGKKVAMVGDGVNDAPALTRAEVGIAIGSGTDVAVESAGIILVKNNPMDVVKIFELSRASYRKMVQNLVWASGYNVITLPLAAGVLAPFGFVLSPALGAILMSLSTVIVAINAQLLRKIDLGK